MSDVRQARRLSHYYRLLLINLLPLVDLERQTVKFVGHFFKLASHFFVGAFDGCFEAAGDAEGAATATGVPCRVAAGVGVGKGACSGTPDCKTELVPVIAGKDRIKANNMNPAAAPIVIFDNSVCVPLGPNAVLETELENSAPASAFPGWSRTVTTSTTHARINSP